MGRAVQSNRRFKKGTIKRIPDSRKNAKQTATKALRIAKKALGSNELGYQDVTSTGNVTWSGNLTQLNLMGQGDGQTQRTGDEINNVWYHNSMAIASSNNYRCRVIVFWDPEDTIVNASGILAATGGTYAVDGPRLYDFRKNTKIIYDKVVTFDSYHINRNLKINLNLRGKKSRYISDGVMSQNALKMIMISDADPAAGNVVNFKFYSRYQFSG